MCFNYAVKYCSLLDNPSHLETFSNSKRNNVLKALIALSKYHGFYTQFKQRIKDYGIKWSKSDSIHSFFRILNNPNHDVLEWYQKTTNVLNDDCSMYLKFQLLSGIRPNEGIESFNLIRTQLNDYYNEELGTLEHFRFKNKFLRRTKNVFITMIPKDFVMEIAEKNEVTYPMIVKKLQRKKIPIRINELRDYYGTFMVRHNVIREEVDLLQGRIGKSVFVRHYFSPALKELKERVLNALNELEQTILS